MSTLIAEIIFKEDIMGKVNDLKLDLLEQPLQDPNIIDSKIPNTEPCSHKL